MMEEKTILKEIQQILHKEEIKTFFQPIVSLKTGNILGYESLSRGPKGSPLEKPLDLFTWAHRGGCLFELEWLCRKKSLERSKHIKNTYKIFLNVDPKIIYDHHFKPGMTKEILKQLSISQKKIIMEITERSSIHDFEGFKKALEHYRNQGFQTAIDDTGSGYSGLQSLVHIKYDYIKLDASLIRDIHRDYVKQVLLETFVLFSHRIGARIIAEGIEKMEELEFLINSSIDYGQGYLLARPEEHIQEELEIETTIRKMNHHLLKIREPEVGDLVESTLTIKPGTINEELAAIWEKDSKRQGIVILEDRKPLGLLMRDAYYSTMGTRFGYNLYCKKPVERIMDKEPLFIEADTPLSQVSRQAMERETSKMYNLIIITRKGEYLGVISIKRLLERFTLLQIDRAKELNPLTSLPGNRIIEEEITYWLNSKKPFSFLYIDMDNFKPFNDSYGYKKGDEVILFLKKLLKEVLSLYGHEEDFLGHIGGDDFIVITSPEKEDLICQEIIRIFDKGILSFFREEDLKRGSFVSRNREGKRCNSHLISLSIALISNKGTLLESSQQISDIAAEIKGYLKQKKGSHYMKNQTTVRQ